LFIFSCESASVVVGSPPSSSLFVAVFFFCLKFNISFCEKKHMTSPEQQIPDIPPLQEESPPPIRVPPLLIQPKKDEQMAVSPDDVSHLVTVSQMVPSSELGEPSLFTTSQINPDLVKEYSQRSDALFGIQQNCSRDSSESVTPLCSPTPLDVRPMPNIAFDDLSPGLTASGMALFPGDPANSAPSAPLPDLLSSVRIPQKSPVFHFQPANEQPGEVSPLCSSRSLSSSLSDIPPLVVSAEPKQDSGSHLSVAKTDEPETKSAANSDMPDSARGTEAIRSDKQENAAQAPSVSAASHGPLVFLLPQINSVGLLLRGAPQQCQVLIQCCCR